MKLSSEEIKAKVILDSNTGKPVKEITVDKELIKITKESGEQIEIPTDSLRGKAILTRLQTDLGEITAPIYL